MQKLLNKITATIATFILISINIMPAIVYASEEVSQDAKTSQENVEFNASINGEYNTALDVNEEGNLILNVKVSGTGYLKESTVTIENNNYEIINREDLNVKSINGNVITLNEVNTGEILNVSIPIKLNKEELIDSDILGRDSEVILDTIYVDKSGKERKINKKLTEHLEWTAELNEVVNQSLIRYIKFDENKTMISFKVNEGLQDNKLPYTSKEIKINVPTLGENKPSNVIVVGNGISYKYEDDILTITKENTPNSDGKITWNSNDEYYVTYIYDNQIDETTIESNIESSVVVKGNTIKGILENNTYELKDEVGKYVEGEILGTDEINKGYMYTNLKYAENKLETPYEINYKTNIGYKDLTNSLKIVENDVKFNSLDASNFILDKKVKINKENLIEILGEDGWIKVLSNDGTELGIISKDNLELEVNVPKVIIETSKIIKEGNLELIVSKVINANNEYNKEQISELTELITNATIESYIDEELNSSKEITKTSKLVEPESNANIDINVQNLSTVVKNENVIITATLQTKDISDALYSNAKINITLPEEVKEINVKESRLIYEDELELTNLKTEGNKISLNLDGTQTKYSTQSTSEGTVVRLVTDLTLDNLAPSREEKVTLDYSNEATGEQKSITDDVGIIAPVGFITTNSLEGYGQKVTAQERNEQIIKIKTDTLENRATISGTVVNNLGYDGVGLTILGTIPTSGNKNANGTDLGSNFDTIITNALSVTGVESEIYYSNNVNETIDGTSWTKDFSQDAKLYKIVVLGNVSNGTNINFSYNIEVPTGLEYGNTSKASYAVYYNNGAEEGSKQNVVLAKAVGITTGEIPVITPNVELNNLNTGVKIENGSNVKERELFTYTLKLKNTGKEVAKNVKVNITLPDGISVAELVTDMTDLPTYQYDSETKELQNIIDTIDVGEEKSIDYKLLVTKILSGEEKEIKEQKIVANIIADEIEENINKETILNIVEGNILGTVSSNKTERTLKAGDEIDYYLEIANANYKTKNNIKATLTIPKEFKVTKIQNNSDTDYEYDEKTNTITYTNPTLRGGATDGIYIGMQVNNVSENKQVDIKATIDCDEMEKENLETLKYNLISYMVKASLTSNIEQSTLNDTDELEYYINIQNSSSEVAIVDINDTIPEGLRVIGYKVQDINGEKQINASARNITAQMEIAPNSSARLTIITEPYALQEGRILKIENKATISLGDIDAETNTLSHTIVGTSQNSAGPSTEPEVGEEGSGEEYVEDNRQTEEGTYKISGSVWVDENSNGRKEESETNLSGVTVKLLDKKSGKIALDVKGNEQVETTNNSGRYTFVNVVPGVYIVVVEYDDVTYELANYKVEGLSDAENSDFVAAKLADKSVAATDDIHVEDANIYNIDLGLVKDSTFDLDISKAITRITVTNTKAETKVYDYNDLSVAKVELATANVDFATVLVEYTISIKNNGQVAGYAKSIVDHIPQGMTFSSELNSSWYLSQDGDAYNTSLANTIINPGETKTVKLVLSRKMSDENTGTVRNTAEILVSYNELGLVDKDYASGDVSLDASEENGKNKSAADLVIGMATGREVASFTGITLGILSIIAVAVYEIKKHIINKMYNII